MRTCSSGSTQLFGVKPHFFGKPTNDFKLKNHLVNLSESLNGFHFWKVECLSFLTHYQPSLYDLYIKIYPRLKFKITTVSQISSGLSYVFLIQIELSISLFWGLKGTEYKDRILPCQSVNFVKSMNQRITFAGRHYQFDNILCQVI